MPCVYGELAGGEPEWTEKALAVLSVSGGPAIGDELVLPFKVP